MKKETLLGENYNNIVYKICQCSLNKITNSVISISFNVENKNLYLAITVNQINELDKNIFSLFENDLANRIQGYKINLEVEKVSESNFKKADYKILDYVLFLRNKYSN